MSTLSHHPADLARDRREWLSQFSIPDVWASLAIMVIWLAVLLDALLGPNMTVDTTTGDHVTIPTAGVMALFAFLATWVVAKYGFHRDREPGD